MKRLPFLSVPLLLILGVFSFADAAIIYQQPVNSDVVCNSNAACQWIPIATSTNPTGMGISGIVTNAILWLKHNSTPIGYWTFEVDSFTNAELTAGQTSVATVNVDTVTSSNGSMVDFDFADFTANAALFYRFSLSCTGCGVPGTYTVYGTTTPAYFELSTNGAGIPYTYLQTSLYHQLQHLGRPQNMTQNHLLLLRRPNSTMAKANTKPII